MAKDFYSHELAVGDICSFDHTLKVEAVLGNQVVLSGKGIILLVPAEKCVRLDEEKLREEVNRK